MCSTPQPRGNPLCSAETSPRLWQRQVVASHAAIRRRSGGHVAALRLLAEHERDIVPDANGQTALHAAAHIAGSPEVVRELLAMGHDVNDADRRPYRVVPRRELEERRHCAGVARARRRGGARGDGQGQDLSFCARGAGELSKHHKVVAVAVVPHVFCVCNILYLLQLFYFLCSLFFCGTSKVLQGVNRVG
eukprot:TRINITY_DN747_c0_g1_i4.p1 TRINITY_DN747_c0_g1~~TRINITY_DN747_c0_g1_i4.p1  ORF type:complete len:191 (+),score=23.43 TRINITY_DN747_c0_g1_i4:570-1142(+)